MSAGIHHALLGLASGALLAAGYRVGAALTDRRLERAVCAFTLAAAAAVAESLLLGLVGLGSDEWALTAAALVTCGAAVALVPAGEPVEGPRLSPPVGALGVLALLLVLWPLRYPLIGFDGAVYHLPEIAMWVESGRPAAVEGVSYLFPFANYPITNEVALTWSSGIARSLVPMLLWTQVLFVMTAVAGVSALRSLGVPPLPRALAVAALLSTPVVVGQLGTPSTDIAGLCWLVCTGALAAGSVRRPALLGPMLVGAGLALGTKTTTLPLLTLVVGLALWHGRAHLRRPALLAGAALGLAVGGTWYVRNLVSHGSPLWPFRSLPGGDEVPHVWSMIDNSLAERPRRTLEGRVDDYLELVAGAVVLFVGAALAWPRARLASAAALGALLVWALAPSTGDPDTPVFDVNVVGTTRYAIPAIAAAAVALALARWTPVLVVAIGWNLIRDVQLGKVYLPYLWVIVLAAAAGAVLAYVPVPRIPRPAAAVAGVLATAALALPADGILERQSKAAPSVPGTLAAEWARRQPGYEDGQTIRFAGTVFGQLAGERFQNRLELVPAGTPCPEMVRLAEEGLLVVADDDLFERLGVKTPAACLERVGARPVGPGVRVYGDPTARSR